MATPTLSLLTYTLIDAAEAVTGWFDFDTLDTDIKKQGNNAITGTFRADGEVGYFDYGSAPVTAAGKHVRIWINTTNLPYMQPESSNGYEFYMYDGSTTEYVVMFGSDTYFGGWKNFVIDCDLFTTLTLANVQRWGIRVNHTGNAKNVDNMWADFIRYCDGYYATGGTSGDEIDLDGIFALDLAGGYGIIDRVEGVFFAAGDIQVGNGATTTWFEMLGEVLIFTDQPVAAGLYKLRGEGSGCRVNIVNSVIQAAGSGDNTRFILDMDDADIVSCNIENSFIVRAGESRFKSGQTINGDTLLDCGQILAGGADFSGASVAGYEGTANTSALVWTPATDPDGLLDDMTFIMGTAATHAIEFGTSSPLTMNLNGIDFSGYNNTVNQNDSPLHIKRTSGTVTINLVGCTGITEDGYRTDGATVVIQATVILTITVKDKVGDAVVGAQVAIYDDSDTQLMNEATIAGGVASESYNYPGSPVSGYYRVRRSSIGSTRYQYARGAVAIDENGLNITVTVTEEPVN